jgi:O-antigen ligase
MIRFFPAATPRHINWVLIGLGILAFLGSGWITASNPTLAFGLVGLLVWVLVCLLAARVALFAIGAFAPLLYLIASQQSLLNTSILIAYGLMAVFVLVNFRPREPRVILDTPLMLSTLAWGMYIWVSRNLSQIDANTWDTKYLLVSATALVPYGWAVLAAPAIRRLSGQKALLIGIAVGTVVVSLVFLLEIQPWSSRGLAAIDWGVTFAALGSLKNSVGLLWVIGVAILLTSTTRLFWLRNLALFILLAGVVYSFSRSSYLAVLLVGLVVVRPTLRRNWFYLGLSCVLAVIALPNALWEKVRITWSPDLGFDLSSSARISLWFSAVNAFISSPFRGVGLDNFTAYLLKSHYLDAAVFAGGATYVYAHNYFLTLFALTGIIGGLLGIYVVWRAYQRSLLSISNHEAGGASAKLVVIAFVVASFFGEPLFDPILLVIFASILAIVMSTDNTDGIEAKSE